MADYRGCYSLPKELVQRKDLNSGEKLLIATIASLSTPDRPCDCTHSQLADRLGCSRVTVARMLQKVHALEYIMVSPRRFPIPRERAHSFYHLPVRVWRFFYRAWAMTGKKWRKFSKVVLDWFEPQIPLEMLMGISDVEKGGSRRSTDSLHRINLTNRSVRWTGPVPVPAEQLSFQAFESNPVEEMLAANAAKGKAVWDNIVSNPEMRHLLLWGCKPETQPA